MIFKISIYVDIKGEAFDPNLLPESLEKHLRPRLEDAIKRHADFPFSSNDTFDRIGSKVAHDCKAKSLVIDFQTKSDVIKKMGK